MPDATPVQVDPEVGSIIGRRRWIDVLLVVGGVSCIVAGWPVQFLAPGTPLGGMLAKNAKLKAPIVATVYIGTEDPIEKYPLV